MNIHQTQHVKQGKVVRKIGFSQNGTGKGTTYVVFEQILERVIRDLQEVDEWQTKFIADFPNRIMARSTYMGLVMAASYEEFGQEHESEAVERSLSYAKPRYTEAA